MIFQLKHTELHSGGDSDFKIECDALTKKDWECLAYLISKRIPFDTVRSVPYGGDILTGELMKYTTNTFQRIILIVDDVLTTGKSMEETRAKLMNLPNNKEANARGVVVFARGKCPDWITPIFQMKL